MFLLQSLSSGIPAVNNNENSLLVGQDESSLARSSKAAGLTAAVILIKYLDEEYLFLCNIYNAVNRLHDSATSTLLGTHFKKEYLNMHNNGAASADILNSVKICQMMIF